MSILYPCGCINFVRPDGLMKSSEKCPAHRREARDPATLDAAYYRQFGVIDEACRPRPTPHVAEMVEALGEFPPAPPSGPRAVALEVGGGPSPYVGAIRAAGYAYAAIEPSAWAARWMQDYHRAPTLEARFEDVEPEWFRRPYALILAAHSIEHMTDAPGAIRKAAGLLAPGGELWVVVPDDSDPLNADHLWFFAPATLRACLESAGLVVERLVARRRVPHELFLYARARRPAGG